MNSVKDMIRRARQGHAKAQYNLGKMYENGCGVKHDSAKALTWFRLAAEQGDKDAMDHLQELGGLNESTEFNEMSRFKNILKHAKQGHAESQYYLGIMYDDGEDGVVEDHAKAVKWYTLAAEQGNIDAQYELGVMYAHGDGAKKDFTQAIKWYTLAAKQGDKFAANNLKLLKNSINRNNLP